MPQSVWARIFVVLLAAGVPPLVLLAALVAWGGGQLTRLGIGTILLAVVGIAALWAGIVAVFGARALASEIRMLVRLAERGGLPGRPESGADDAGTLNAAQRRLVSLMEERDRQLRELAAQTAAAPITDDAQRVARHVVHTARTVTRDSTWSLAVISGDILPPGVYGDDTDDAGPIGDLEKWASVTQSRAGRARRVDGPWGSFLVVDVGVDSGVHALLLAPWAGREEPRPADLTLLDLLGQHAATALEHATLYSRVRAQAEELDRLSHIQADFLRGVTHDLQTPLTSISALAAELRREESLSDAAAADLQAIVYQADRLRRMVGQLLTLSALEAGGIQPRGEVFRVEPIVRRVWRTLQVENRQLTVETRGPDRLAVGDPARVEQVCWALLDNAVKYSPADSTVRVVLDARRPMANDPQPSSDLVEEIVIRDEGMGLDDEARGRAFERFYRSPEARQRVPDGSGIGLFTARRLIELMGGSVAIDSDGEAGATVRVVLPAEPAVRESPEAA